MQRATRPAAPTQRRRAERIVASRRRMLVLLVVAGLAGVPGTSAYADTIGVRAAELRAEDDGIHLTAEFDLAINATLEEALRKGVPLYFSLELEVTRPRWYWFDEKALSYSIQYRVAYNALTQQYRVASGLLAQTFNSLDEVQRFLSRVTSRLVARRDQLAVGAHYEAAVRLRLDGNQLPKPFQVSALASRDWTLQSEWHRWSVAL